MSELNVAVLRDGFTKIVAKLEESAAELNALDATLGDGDIGVSLLRGGRSLLTELPSLPSDDLGAAFMRCAQAITSISGSTCGTLLAAGLLGTAKKTMGKPAVPWSEVSGLLAASVEAISRRGKCELGDKTILDAVEAARRAAEGLTDPGEIVSASNKAVGEAVETFRHQASLQGRARIFPDRSIGNPDPGMVAFKRILEALQ
jgi:dihydroxyacetone kinase-like protein